MNFLTDAYRTIANLHLFWVGGACVLHLIAALLFLRSYRKTRDRLFLFFSAAFAIMGLNRFAFAFFESNNEPHPILYLVRLTAFFLILYAIFDKNFRRRPASKSTP